jgi:sugar lactone lactonase YvrE
MVRQIVFISLLFAAAAPGFELVYRFSFGADSGEVRPLRGPRSLCTGADGSVFVVDAGLHRVVKFSPQGRALAETGGPGSGPGRFDTPLGITRAGGFSLYICDAQNFRLVQIDDRLNFVSAFTLNGRTADGVFRPTGAAYAAEGLIYLCDTDDGDLLRLSRDGRSASLFREIGALRARSLRPRSIAAAGGYVFTDDEKSGRLYRFDKFGNFLGAFGRDLVVPLSGLTAADDSLLLAADQTKKACRVFTPGGREAGVLPVSDAHGPFAPGGIHYAGGRLYVINPERNTIAVFERR